MLYEAVTEAEGGGSEGIGGGGVGGGPVASVVTIPLEREPEHLHDRGTCVKGEGKGRVSHEGKGTSSVLVYWLMGLDCAGFVCQFSVDGVSPLAVLTQHYGQPLPVGNPLHDSAHYLARLEEQSVVVPQRVDLLQ